MSISEGETDKNDKDSITPLQKDPKQQELRIHLRPRLDLGPYGGLV